MVTTKYFLDKFLRYKSAKHLSQLLRIAVLETYSILLLGKFLDEL